jgi:hypothetical protein
MEDWCDENHACEFRAKIDQVPLKQARIAILSRLWYILFSFYFVCGRLSVFRFANNEMGDQINISMVNDTCLSSSQQSRYFMRPGKELGQSFVLKVNKLNIR